MDDRKRLDELAKRAVYTGRAQFTRFLEPAAEREVRAAANAAGASVKFFGGYEDAERRIAAFHDGEIPEDWEFPMQALEIAWNVKFCTVQHRDLLGSAMGLGLEREALGDVCLGREPGVGYLFCASDMADYICANWESAGRAKISVGYAGSVDIAEPEGVQLRVTVQQLRLDSLVAAGWKLSRAEAQRLIAAGLVKLNHAVEEKSDVRVEEGGLISARGYGRLRVDEIEGETKKGRMGLKLFRYGK